MGERISKELPVCKNSDQPGRRAPALDSVERRFAELDADGDWCPAWGYVPTGWALTRFEVIGTSRVLVYINGKLTHLDVDVVSVAMNSTSMKLSWLYDHIPHFLKLLAAVDIVAACM